jgi:hypothetical protein
LIGISLPLVAAATPYDWFDSNTEFEATNVNEGKLVFLAERPTTPFHRQSSRLVISADSLNSGWVRLHQCHVDLDPVHRAQIVYHPDRVRKLTVVSAEGVAEVRVEGPSVQLAAVGPGARLCVSAETRALHDNGDATWTLVNGPFMRRFLDGYYPLGVSLQVELPPGRLSFLGIEPPEQPGFEVGVSRERVRVEALFEGRLSTRIVFCAIDEC